MKVKIISVLLVFVTVLSCHAIEGGQFSSRENKEDFFREISHMVGKAWKNWQDSVVINNVEVQGSTGELRPGDMADPVLTSESMMVYYTRAGRGQECIDCVKAVTGALEHGMRSWQRGYQNRDIPFPQGASCTYTMPPSKNVPVSLASGNSKGDRDMTEKALYSFMVYRAPNESADIKVMFRAIAKAFAGSFDTWKRSCSISDITASGGIAPQPSPMGTGPGPVRGAKGNCGKLDGPYITEELLYSRMTSELSS